MKKKFINLIKLDVEKLKYNFNLYIYTNIKNLLNFLLKIIILLFLNIFIGTIDIDNLNYFYALAEEEIKEKKKIYYGLTIISWIKFFCGLSILIWFLYLMHKWEQSNITSSITNIDNIENIKKTIEIVQNNDIPLNKEQVFNEVLQDFNNYEQSEDLSEFSDEMFEDFSSNEQNENSSELNNDVLNNTKK